MNKVSKTLVIMICSIAILSGVVFAAFKIYENFQGKAEMIPTFTGNIQEGNGNVETGAISSNKVWVGTFNLAWNELMEEVTKGPVEFKEGNSAIVDELNKQSFTKEMLNENSYYVETGLVNEALRDTIEKNLSDKLNTKSDVLERINWNSRQDRYLIYAILNKNFTFKTPFPKDTGTFGDYEDEVSYFVLDAPTEDKTFEQVTALFYNSENDFAVKIDTVEGDELLLYRTDTVESFDKAYNELIEKTNSYTGRKELIREKDELRVPFIKINTDVNYDELCNKTIKGTNGAYIEQAIQTVKFELNNYGGNIKSEAIVNIYLSASLEIPRYFYFNDNFVLFMKEKDKEKPYFALLVDDISILDVYVDTEA